MHWQHLTELEQLHLIIDETKQQPSKALTVILFKHSTRCSISSMALNRFETKWQDNPLVKTYYLDLLAHRNISNEIATLVGVEHASPQIIVIQNGKCIYHNSHNAINVTDILTAIAGT